MGAPALRAHGRSGPADLRVDDQLVILGSTCKISSPGLTTPPTVCAASWQTVPVVGDGGLLVGVTGHVVDTAEPTQLTHFGHRT
jgi:hypothetical protein